MVIAMRASVTVSIAELSNGIFSAIDWVTRVRVSAVFGRTLDAPGTSKTSSKVKASRSAWKILFGQGTRQVPISRLPLSEKAHSCGFRAFPFVRSRLTAKNASERESA